MRRLMLITPGRSGTHIIFLSLKEEHDCILWHPQFHRGEWDPSREKLYLERRDSYAWAMANIYNYNYNPYIFGDDCLHNLWTTGQQRKSIEHQRERLAQQGPVLLTASHFKHLVQQWCDYLEFKHHNPSLWPTLYYEDVSLNPNQELRRWKLHHSPTLASVKTLKIPPQEAWQNPEEFRYLWSKWVAADMRRRVGKG